MKYLIHVLLLFLIATLPAQESKGVTPLPNSSATAHGAIKAVIVGISEYQHKSIPDLQFAHRDAQAFADWLASPAGGRVPSENITVLLNENATAGQVISALDGLTVESGDGDLALIYFSGHGDIEKVTTRQNGFLLCHDAPATTYPAGGCLPLGYLQDIVSTISDKKCRIVLVTDACHAGNLAGSVVNGTQTTNAALAKQFLNEVKIMSCQSNELALEGEQWGGGRGVFSFNLIEGLTGFADKDADGIVSLLEIGRYLEDRVRSEAAPHPQTPLVLGDRGFPIARVDAPMFAALQKSKAGEKASFQKTDIRGFASGIIPEADSATQELYLAFQAALDRGDYLTPAESSAEFFYQKLQQNKSLGSLHNLLRRNYAAALQDEIQQAINALLDNDPYEANNWNYNPEKYSSYPAYLARTIELLGETHYMTASLKSKKAYFEGYEIAKTIVGFEGDPVRRDALRDAAKQKYLEGINYDPDAAYLYFAVGDLYLENTPYRTDSLEFWCKQAFERSPAWVTPALEMSYEFHASQVRNDLAEKWILEALEVLPNSYLVQQRLAWLRQWQNRRDEAVGICEKLIAQKPELFNGYATLGNTICLMDGDYPEAERFLRKAVELNPDFANDAYVFLGVSIFKMRRVQEGIEMLQSALNTSLVSQRGLRFAYLVEAYGQAGDYEKAEQFARRTLEEKCSPFNQTISLMNLGKIRVRQNRLTEASALFEKSLAADPTPDGYFIFDWAWLGEVARLQNKPVEAEAFFKKSVAYESGLGWEDMPPKEEAYYLYGNFLLRQNRLTEAAAEFQKSLDIRRKGFWGEYGFALMAAKKGRKSEALDWMEKSLENFYPEPESILAEPLFKNIRKTKRFKALMMQHFPDTQHPQK